MKQLLSICPLAWLLFFLPALQASPHCVAELGGPTLKASYKVIDLGATDLSQEQLTRLEPLYSLAPLLNEKRLVVYNRQEGAFVRNLEGGEYALRIPGAKLFAHALNNNGAVLLSIHRQEHDIEWMIWCLPKKGKGLSGSARTHLGSLGKDNKLFFCSINDRETVAGYKESGDKLTPLIWTPCKGLQALGQNEACFDIEGFPRGLNNCDTVAGYFEDVNDAPPFIWNHCLGLDVLRNYRSSFHFPGWIELADMVLNSQNVVYGTYLMKYISARGNSEDLNHYFLYRWDAAKGGMHILGVRDMRITSINVSDTLVGSLNGHAAIRYPGQQPMDANALIANGNKEWELLEATKINDRGEVIGYGRYRGDMHIFLLQPAS